MLQHMHPLGLTDDWADKLKGQAFTDDSNGITYEHYMQVRGGARGGAPGGRPSIARATWLRLPG